MQDGFEWLNKYEAFCMSFAQGLDHAEMLRRIGGDPRWARWIEDGDFEQYNEIRSLGAPVQVGVDGEWAFAYEDNGFEGTFNEVLQRLSEDTVAVSIFRNVNAVTRFCYASEGQVLHNISGDELVYRPSHLYEDLYQQLSELTAARTNSTSDPMGQSTEHYPRPDKGNDDDNDLNNDDEGELDNDDEFDDEEFDDDDYLDRNETLFSLAAAAGVTLRWSSFERPLLTTIIRSPASDFLGDVFAEGCNAETTDRLWRLLDDYTQSGLLLRILNSISYYLSDTRHFRSEEFIHRLALKVLQELNTLNLLPALLAALEGKTTHNREKALELLKIFLHFERIAQPEGTAERLLLLTRAADPELAHDAAIALGTLHDQRAIAPLMTILERSPQDRQAIRLLGELRAKPALPLLLSLVNPQEKSSDFIRILFTALEQIGDAQLAADLLPYLKEQSSVSTFYQCLLALLAHLGSPELTPTLLPLLNPHPQDLHSYDFQLHLLKALGNLGDPQAREPLADLLLPDASTCTVYEYHFQDALVKALRQLGETRDLAQLEQSIQQRESKATYRITLRKQNTPPDQSL